MLYLIIFFILFIGASVLCYIYNDKTILTFEKHNIIKTSPIGFSYTTLFFGCLVPLFRGDWKWGLVMLVASTFTLCIAGCIFPFIYNKIYITSLLENGWIPDENTRKILIDKKYIKQ